MWLTILYLSLTWFLKFFFFFFQEVFSGLTAWWAVYLAFINSVKMCGSRLCAQYCQMLLEGMCACVCGGEGVKYKMKFDFWPEGVYNLVREFPSTENSKATPLIIKRFKIKCILSLAAYILSTPFSSPGRISSELLNCLLNHSLLVSSFSTLTLYLLILWVIHYQIHAFVIGWLFQMLIHQSKIR